MYTVLAVGELRYNYQTAYKAGLSQYYHSDDIFRQNTWMELPIEGGKQQIIPNFRYAFESYGLRTNRFDKATRYASRDTSFARFHKPEAGIGKDVPNISPKKYLINIRQCNGAAINENN